MFSLCFYLNLNALGPLLRRAKAAGHCGLWFWLVNGYYDSVSPAG
jgi:hypothetical protein